MPDAKDFRELTDLAQDLARVQKQSLEEQIEMSSELRTKLIDRAKIFSGMNDIQKSMIRDAGGQMLQIYKEDLSIQQQILDKKREAAMMAGEDTASIQKQMDYFSRINDINDESLETLYKQASQMQDMSDVAGVIEQIEQDIRDIGVEKLALQEDHLGLADEEAAKLVEMLETMQKSKSVQLEATKIEKSRLEAEEKATNLFGIRISQVQERAKDIESTLTNWPALILSTATLALRAFDSLRTEAQLGVGQTVDLVGRGLSGWATSLKSGVIVGAEGAARAAGQLANEIGRTDLLTGDLIAKQIRLTTIYGMSGDQSAKLLETLEVIGGHSEEFTSSSLQFMENLARANDIPIGALMSDVASSASSFAVSSAESLNNLIRSVAEAKRLGLDINKVVSFAESSVMNPDNFIQNVARLRTFGFDIADPIGLLALANDPSRQEELVNEIANTLTSTGKDLASVSRIDRQLLEQTFGMDFEEIRKVAERAGKAGPLKGPEAAKGGDMVQNLTASMLRFTHDVDLASLAMNAAALALAAKSITGIGGGIGKLFGAAGMAGMLGKAGGALKFVGKAAPVAGAGIEAALNVADIIKGGTAAKRGAYGLGGGAIGATLGMVGGPAGMLIGGAIGSAIGRAIAPKETAEAAGAAAAHEQRAAAAAGAEQIVVVDTARLESKMDELIAVSKTPPPIYMDGQLVMAILQKGTPRANAAPA